MWMILIFSCYLRHFFILDYKQLLINNTVILKYYNVKSHLTVDVILSVPYFLRNLSKEKKTKREIDLLHFIVVDVTFGVIVDVIVDVRVLILTWSNERTSNNILKVLQLNTNQELLSKRLKGLRKRLVKEVSWSNPVRVKQKTGNQGRGNLNKLRLRVIIRRINNCCQGIIPSNTKSGFSPWYSITLLPLTLKWNEVKIPCQRNFKNNRFLLCSMRCFLQK